MLFHSSCVKFPRLFAHFCTGGVASLFPIRMSYSLLLPFFVFTQYFKIAVSFYILFPSLT